MFDSWTCSPNFQSIPDVHYAMEFSMALPIHQASFSIVRVASAFQNKDMVYTMLHRLLYVFYFSVRQVNFHKYSTAPSLAAADNLPASPLCGL